MIKIQISGETDRDFDTDDMKNALEAFAEAMETLRGFGTFVGTVEIVAHTVIKL